MVKDYPITAIAADLKVIGYKRSKFLELEGGNFRLAMTPDKAYELGAAILKVVWEIRLGTDYRPLPDCYPTYCEADNPCPRHVTDVPGMYDEPDEGLSFGGIR